MSLRYSQSFLGGPYQHCLEDVLGRVADALWHRALDRSTAGALGSLSDLHWRGSATSLASRALPLLFQLFLDPCSHEFFSFLGEPYWETELSQFRTFARQVRIANIDIVVGVELLRVVRGPASKDAQRIHSLRGRMLESGTSGYVGTTGGQPLVATRPNPCDEHELG